MNYYSLDEMLISNHFLNKFMYLCIPIDKLLIWDSRNKQHSYFLVLDCAILYEAFSNPRLIYTTLLSI